VSRVSGAILQPDELCFLWQAGADPHRPLAAGHAALGVVAGGALEFAELEEFLLARAMEHDSPSLLFRLACEYSRSSRVVRQGPVTLIERVTTARARAERAEPGGPPLASHWDVTRMSRTVPSWSTARHRYCRYR
jgi:hypothetical protein